MLNHLWNYATGIQINAFFFYYDGQIFISLLIFTNIAPVHNPFSHNIWSWDSIIDPCLFYVSQSVIESICPSLNSRSASTYVTEPWFVLVYLSLIKAAERCSEFCNLRSGCSPGTFQRCSLLYNIWSPSNIWAQTHCLLIITLCWN